MPKRRSDEYATRAFDFCARIRDITDPDEIRQLIEDELKHYGFDYVTCALVPGPGQDAMAGVMMNTRPASYVQHYVENDYTHVDPVVTELAHTLRPYSWSDVRRNRPLSKGQLGIMDEAREFKVRDGLIVPVVPYTGGVSIFSPCGERPELSARARAAVEIIGVAGLQALRRAIIESTRARDDYHPLTRREREVMHWVAVGKTDDEISIILGMHPKTVNTHVESAKRKLNATRRTLAIVEALRRGEITI